MTEDRAQQVAQAWESLLRIRGLVQPDHSELPAPWERAQPVRAVALALEAAGVPICAVDGDAVVEGGAVVEPEERGGTRVTWRYLRGQRAVDAGEADLGAAADALGRAGWDALLYRAGRVRYLLVEPGRGG
ncbi:hypothetical protein I2501_04045 [Streptacidiphilus sp. NEAU-YB345]|uniref:Uncharacterized protein n=1 Tax=Streptacidiphilus fuscans TaxID=2789292 RepID=A0A931B1Z1_9ACTN|nr:hypothetical protein [Streptacidiphilus fuscans]